MSVHWLPIIPPALIALVVLGLLGLLGYGSWLLTRKNVPVQWIGILAGVRVVVIIVFVFCMLQPIVSCSRGVKQGQPILVLLDTSQSMSVSDASGKGSRLQEVLAWMESSGLKSKLEKNGNTLWFAADQSSRPVEAADLKSLLANGATTRYAESISSAWNFYHQSAAAAGAASSGIIILAGDGNDFGARDPAEVAQSLGATVYTLPPAAAKDGRGGADVAIANVQTPRRVLLGSETRFLVTLRQKGMEGKPLALHLKEAGKDLFSHPMDVTFSAGQTERQISLSYRPTEPGIKEYELEIAANPPDAVKENNSSKISIQVLSAKNEVLFIEDSWRWEFKFLRRIFEDDPSFTFTGFISRRGEHGYSYFQMVEPDRKVNLGSFPQTKAELERFDTIILGDVNPKNWTKALAPALHSLVVEDGKSLIVIAGPNIANMADIPALASLLPVEITEQTGTPIEGPIPVKQSAEGVASPFFFSANQGIWMELRPVDQIYPVLRKRPAATVLIEAADKANNYGNLIVIAEHTVGRGRVLFIGTDTLWKWQTNSVQTDNANSPYLVFWQQALRGLAPVRLSQGSVNLWLQPERSKYETGETIVLRAEVQSERPIAKPKITAKVTLPDKKTIPLDFAPHPTQSGLYIAQIEASMPGQHQIAGLVTVEGKTAAEAVAAVDVEKSLAEMSNIDVNESNLARIASETGGKLMKRDDPKTWPTEDNVSPVVVQKTRLYDLWNNFTLMILLALLLGVDWLIRLLRGYV